NIKKSKFKIIYIKYLGFIISIFNIKIDSNKIEELYRLLPRLLVKLLLVQFFLGFYNIYKYFIREYKRITRFLILLIKKGISFK
ncbi:uncharacterized protein K444DRAFT_536619, partial [Hyaloscypha bicolor E]